VEVVVGSFVAVEGVVDLTVAVVEGEVLSYLVVGVVVVVG